MSIKCLEEVVCVPESHAIPVEVDALKGFFKEAILNFSEME